MAGRDMCGRHPPRWTSAHRRHRHDTRRQQAENLGARRGADDGWSVGTSVARRPHPSRLRALPCRVAVWLAACRRQQAGRDPSPGETPPEVRHAPHERRLSKTSGLPPASSPRAFSPISVRRRTFSGGSTRLMAFFGVLLALKWLAVSLHILPSLPTTERRRSGHNAAGPAGSHADGPRAVGGRGTATAGNRAVPGRASRGSGSRRGNRPWGERDDAVHCLHRDGLPRRRRNRGP
jgi:hypothetical protein